MTNKEAIKYLIPPVATSTGPSAEYLKQKEAYDLAIKALEERPQGDLISREALLKRVDEERKYLIARGQTGAEHILVHNFRDLIDNAPTVEYTFEEAFQTTVCEQRLYCPERPQWIPVSERLPEYSGLYLISVDDLVTVANFTGTYFMRSGGGRVKVYAWQPLPDPYKEGGAV